MNFQETTLSQIVYYAESAPEAVAFCIDEHNYSYSDFVNQIAAIITVIESKDEDFIGILTEDNLFTYAAILATWFSGKAFVPINPDNPIDRNENIVQQVGIKTVLTKNKFPNTFENGIEKLKEKLKQNISDEAPAYVFFTSGSTGVPKGVVITRGNLNAFVISFNQLKFNITPKDRFLQMFELTFDLSVMSYLIPLINGCSIYTIPKDRLKYSYVYYLLDEQKITFALMVPSILNYLRRYFTEINCPELKYCLFCGEALETALVAEWSKCIPNAEIYNVYGPTENTIFCTYYKYNTKNNLEQNGILSIGKSMFNNILEVFNEKNEIAEENESGELCLAGPQLTPGYFNNSTLNSQTFFDSIYKGTITRFYRTGDICIKKNNNDFLYLNRKDNQIKIQGFRIELSEIEFHLKKLLQNRFEAIIVVQKDALGNNSLHGVIESDEFDISEMKDNLRLKLPEYMIPVSFYFLNSFPLNSNGKIDRNQIKKIVNEI